MSKIEIKRFFNDGTVDSAYYQSEAHFLKSPKSKDKRLKVYTVIDIVTKVVLSLVSVFGAVKSLKKSS